jgi:hypothetical protein
LKGHIRRYRKVSRKKRTRIKKVGAQEGKSQDEKGSGKGRKSYE